MISFGSRSPRISAAEMGSDGEAHDGKYYKHYKSIVHDYNFLTANEDFHDIAGYKQASSDCTFSDEGRYPASGTLTAGTVNKFYYDRVSYAIEFKDSYTKSMLKEATVKYTGAIETHVPTDNPTSTRTGYSFTGWYVDEACSTKVFFDADAYNAAASLTNKVLFTEMPSHNLVFYAGWETDWYLIQIDPNGGMMTDDQSLWFWEAYDGDPIALTQIAALTQLVMCPKCPKAPACRKVWVAALERAKAATDDGYVKTFCDQQLRLCK